MWRNAVRNPAKGTRHTITAMTPAEINNCFQGTERKTVCLQPTRGHETLQALHIGEKRYDLNQMFLMLVTFRTEANGGSISLHE
jgi:hypothetical protein